MAGNSHFKRTLIHTCTVERPSYAQSTSGEPVPSWATVAEDVRCRYVQKQERIAFETISLQMEQRDLLLLLPGADIDEGDRVSDIRLYSDDTLVDAGPFTVEARLTRNARAARHISVQLERIE